MLTLPHTHEEMGEYDFIYTYVLREGLIYLLTSTYINKVNDLFNSVISVSWIICYLFVSQRYIHVRVSDCNLYIPVMDMVQRPLTSDLGNLLLMLC